MEAKTLVALYPRLFHMAEQGTWTRIRQDGLLSTSALLDRYDVHGTDRVALEQRHRPDKVTLGDAGDHVLLRDQKPMAPSRLGPALQDGLTAEQWYKLLNVKVFIWAEERKLDDSSGPPAAAERGNAIAVARLKKS